MVDGYRLVLLRTSRGQRLTVNCGPSSNIKNDKSETGELFIRVVLYTAYYRTVHKG